MKDKYIILIIILLGLFFYSLTLRGAVGNPKPTDFKNNLDQPTRSLELSPERGRFATVLALGDFYTYDLGQTLADAVYPDVGYYNGKFYSFFAPGLAYMDLPFYLVGKHFDLSQIFSFAFISLVSVLSLIFLYKIARNILKLSLRASLFSVLVFAFATTAWSYAITLYQHHVTVFFMLSSFYAAWKYGQPGKLRWLYAAWVWLAYGVAITVDYPNAVILLPVMVYFLVVSFRIVKDKGLIKISLRPAILVTFIAFLAVLSLQAYHSKSNFGSWTRLSGQLADYSNLKEGNTFNMTDTSKQAAQISAQKGLVGFFHETNVPFSFYTLTISPDRGLFFFSPILLLAFFGIYRIRKKLGFEAKTLLALAVVNVFLYSSWGDPWGGWAYGPRYLIPTMAILSLFVAAWVFREGGKLWEKILASILFLYSSAVALLGALVTNSVPPKIEAVNLPLHYYNYLFDAYLLKQGKNGSFFYNTFLSHSLGLKEYYVLIYAILILTAFLVLFLSREKKSTNVKIQITNSK